MEVKGKRIGFVLTGSFCTFNKTIPKMKELKKEGKNIVIKEENKSMFYFLLNSFKDEFIIILICLAIINFFLQDKLGSLIILIIALISALIRLVQDYSVDKFNHKLKSSIYSTTTVLRNHQEVEIKVDDIVKGDIVKLKITTNEKVVAFNCLINYDNNIFKD